MKLFTLIFITLSLIYCKTKDNDNSNLKELTPNSFQTPLEKIDIQYQEFSINAINGDTIIYSSGSIILFPPNSFLDETGKIVKGQVKIKYREFKNPIDFYLAGIPMNYDSSGVNYTFESSGMCEILAYKDSLPLKINSLAQPEIFLRTKNISANDNLYYFDKSINKWILRSGIQIINLNNIENVSNIDTIPTIANVDKKEIIEQILPEKANNRSPKLRISIEPNSFKELLDYDNLLFQLEPNETINPRDTMREWKNVELIKGLKIGTYIVKFSDITKSISYAVRPVLEEEDYKIALANFNQKNNNIQNNLKNKNQNSNYSNLSKIRNSNHKIIQSSSKDRLQEIINKLDRKIEKNDSINNVKLSESKKQSLLNDIYSSFAVNKLGFWNCDRISDFKLITIVAKFTDSVGNPLTLSNISVINKSLNSVFNYFNNNIKILNVPNQMIIGVSNGRFAYISYKDFNKIAIPKDSSQQTYMMTVVDERLNNYQYIRSLF